MSGSTIEQAIGYDEAFESLENKTVAAPDQELATEQNDFNMNFNFDWIKTPTGEGTLESYLEHPLNFNKSIAMSRILRGATGFFGDLKLAIVDISVGILEMVKERRSKNAN